MDLVLAAKAALMGLVEGLTEFIPVSSTGHLIAVGDLIGFMSDHPRARDAFEVVIQLGAILAVAVLFRERLWRLVLALPSDPAARRFFLKLIVGFIPAGAVGLLTHKYVEDHLMNAGVVAAVLALGGLAILLIERRTPRPALHTDAMNLPWPTVMAIGCCQCISLVLPGTSRSAATILGGILLGVDRRAATEFSFFLALPTMCAATGYSLLKKHEALGEAGWGILAIGFVVSFIVAWVVIAWLLRFVANHTFTAFGWYRIFAGLVLAGLCAAGIVSHT